MKLICPECKNEVNLAMYPNLERDHVIECDVCGITLRIEEMRDNGQVLAQVIDEGK